MKNKKLLWVALPIVAVIALVIALLAVFIPANSKASDKVAESTLGEYIPIDSDTVVITPNGADWWKTLSAFTPVFFDLKNHAPGDRVNVSYYGYSRSPNHQKEVLAGTGPLQLVYLESPSDEDAKGVADWLRENVAPESKGMDVKTIKNVNVVSYNWATLHLEKTDQPLSGDPLFTKDVPLIWMNYDKMKEVLSKPTAKKTVSASGTSEAPPIASADETGSLDISSVLRSAVGITDGTVWRATSKDNGASWGGKFVAGGIDKSQINPKKANELVVNSSKVIVEGSRDGLSKGTSRVSTVGLLPLESRFGLKYDGIEGSFGSAPGSDGLPSVPGQIISGASGIGTSTMDMVMKDSGSSSSSIDGSQISASESEMNVKFTESNAYEDLYKK